MLLFVHMHYAHKSWRLSVSSGPSDTMCFNISKWFANRFLAGVDFTIRSYLLVYQSHTVQATFQKGQIPLCFWIQIKRLTLSLEWNCTTYFLFYLGLVTSVMSNFLAFKLTLFECGKCVTMSDGLQWSIAIN